MRRAHVAMWIVVGLLVAGAAPAGERGTPEEAQALLARAVLLVESEGEQQGPRGLQRP